MKKILLTLGLLLPTTAAVWAGETGIQWAKPDAKIFAAAPLIGAQKFKTFSADLVQIYAALSRTGAPFQLQLPLPDGSFRTFKVRYTPISSEEMYRRNPGLETYTFTAEQVGNPGVTAKLDVTPHGFHAMILDGGNQYFIDPYNRSTTSEYIVYDKRDMSTEGRQRMICEMAEIAAVPTPPTGPDTYVSGAVQRDFRIALSCTGEYAQASTGISAPTKLQVLARMITTLNRVNGVYEKELAMHFTLIPNTDTLIFLDGSTDPFSNNAAQALINENQIVTTNLIGPSNYDLGHVFSTGGGGLASLGVLCNADKAKGVTGSPNPIGDPFDIDYVAHEVGHQLNAQHTFNAATGSCSGNGVSSQAFEPGSGSTIMAYAGICGGGDNLQQNSHAYFHTSSLRTIASFLTTRSCGLNLPSGNLPPVLPPTVASYSIPFLTPFELIAPQATSANSSGAITYCWEEYDLGSFRSSFANTITAGPIFRSFPPIDSPTRVFPTPARLVRNTFYYIGEKLPTVSRSLNFRLTVREVRNGLGTINIPDGGDVALNVIKTVDTFQITSFSDPALILRGNQPAQVQWNVATTDAAPINCATVDIYFSTDSGYTFPYLLKKATPNDGSESVLLPNINTTKGRIKVKASENVFFCLNAIPLTVTETPESIANVVYEKELKLFPVPATDVVTVQNQLKGGEAQLYNLMGQQVWKGFLPTGSSTILVKEMPRGAYYFRFQQAGDVQVATRSLLLQ
jgi:hypothetical protein